MITPLPFSLILIALASSTEQDLDAHDLARKIKSGDHKAFQEFYNNHYDSLLYFLMSRNTSKENAEDLIQKAFIYIWENRAKIEPDKSLRAYIFRIAYTRMLNHHRDEKKFNNDDDLPEQVNEVTPEDNAQKSELDLAIDKSIKAMPQKRGEVFTLCFMEQLTYNEAAETLGVSKKTIENHMGLALKDIRHALERFK
ncbi:MAG: sigma-70 family RNA polymerase sigma factor [Balneolaceae bacterium]